MDRLWGQFRRVECRVTREWARSGISSEKFEDVVTSLNYLCQLHSCGCQLLSNEYEIQNPDRRAEADSHALRGFQNGLTALSKYDFPDLAVEEYLALARVHAPRDPASRVFRWTGPSYTYAIKSAWMGAMLELSGIFVRPKNWLVCGDFETILPESVEDLREQYLFFLHMHKHWSDGRVELVWKDHRGRLFKDEDGKVPLSDSAEPPRPYMKWQDAEIAASQKYSTLKKTISLAEWSREIGCSEPTVKKLPSFKRAQSEFAGRIMSDGGQNFASEEERELAAEKLEAMDKDDREKIVQSLDAQRSLRDLVRSELAKRRR